VAMTGPPSDFYVPPYGLGNAPRLRKTEALAIDRWLLFFC